MNRPMNRADIAYFEDKQKVVNKLFYELDEIACFYKRNQPLDCNKILTVGCALQSLSEFWEYGETPNFSRYERLCDELSLIERKYCSSDSYVSGKLSQAGMLILEMLDKYRELSSGI